MSTSRPKEVEGCVGFSEMKEMIKDKGIEGSSRDFQAFAQGEQEKSYSSRLALLSYNACIYRKNGIAWAALGGKSRFSLVGQITEMSLPDRLLPARIAPEVTRSHPLALIFGHIAASPRGRSVAKATQNSLILTQHCGQVSTISPRVVGAQGQQEHGHLPHDRASKAA